MQKEFAPEKRAVDRRKAAEMSKFWKDKGPASGATQDDEEFTRLLRAGKSSMKRHYELTGQLAELEASVARREAHKDTKQG
jgi:hypothetical protein